MAVFIGEVDTIPQYENADKAQVMKISEELMEVFSAWEEYNFYRNSAYCKDMLLLECADVMQALCNLIAGLGVNDFKPYMDACKKRNEERGRHYEQG